jgi:hypothetical protein
LPSARDVSPSGPARRQSGDLLDVVEIPEGEGERKLRDEVPRREDVSQARREDSVADPER